jgi:hypothetical protein
MGRAQLGFDVQPAVDHFAIGCIDFKNTGGPIFVWMQSGTHVAYSKILAENIAQGERTLLVH